VRPVTWPAEVIDTLRSGDRNETSVKITVKRGGGFSETVARADATVAAKGSSMKLLR
jgi:hypothetical protein